MTGNLSLLIKKYSVPALFTLTGIAMLYLGLQSSQNSVYTIATIMMLVAGILSFLYSSGTLSAKMLTFLGIGAGVVSMVALYLSTVSVKETFDHQQRYAACVAKAQANLRDIRTAQKAYAEANGKYASDWKDLVNFINEGQVPTVNAVGVVPSRKITEAERNFLYGDNRAIDNNMTELEAVLLSRSTICPDDLKEFKRDTVMVSFMSTKFGSRSYKEGRIKAGIGPFYPDSLPYIPMANGKKWKLETVDSLQIGEDFIPAIKVSGMLPLARIQGEKTEELSFGKLTSNDTGGSWEQ